MRANASPYVMMGLSKMESTASSLLDLIIIMIFPIFSNILHYISGYFIIIPGDINGFLNWWHAPFSSRPLLSGLMSSETEKPHSDAVS